MSYILKKDSFFRIFKLLWLNIIRCYKFNFRNFNLHISIRNKFENNYLEDLYMFMYLTKM
jgi:hypothetical protein